MKLLEFILMLLRFSLNTVIPKFKGISIKLLIVSLNLFKVFEVFYFLELEIYSSQIAL